MTPEQALLRVTNASRVPGAVCQGLADHVFQLRVLNPDLMVRWGRVADAAAARTLDPEAAGLARAHFGNSLRVTGAFTEALAALKCAEEVLPTAHPLVHEFRASLLLSIRDFKGAKCELQRAYDLRTLQNDEIGLAKVLIQAAMVSDFTQKHEEAVRLLEQAIDILARVGAEGRDFLLIALQNLADCLISAGQLARARELLDILETPAAALGEHFAVKFTWLKARLASYIGTDEDARRLYEAARTGFRELGMPREVALISLHLSALHHQYGRYATCVREALKVKPELEALDLDQNAQVTDLLGQIATRSGDLEQHIWTLTSVVAGARQKQRASA